MKGGVFAKHASLSEQLRTASANLQSSLDALGSMGPWDAAAPGAGGSPAPPRSPAANGSPPRSPVLRPAAGGGSPQSSLLIERIQELEATQQRQLQEQGELRMQLTEKEDKMRKLMAAHKRLKSKGGEASGPPSPAQARQAQSMEARKRAAEAAAKKAIAEKKELQREAKKLREQLFKMTDRTAGEEASGWGGESGDDQGGESLRREAAARARAETELEEERAARAKAEAGAAPSAIAVALQKERDALQRQLDQMRTDLTKPAEGGKKRGSQFIASARTREEMKAEAVRMEATIEQLAAAKTVLEEQRAADTSTREEAESKAEAAEAKTAELARALSDLMAHCEELEAKESTLQEHQRMVADMRSATQAALADQQQEQVEAVQQAGLASRDAAEQDIHETVDEVVAQATRRLTGALDEVDGLGWVENTEAAIATAKQQVAEEKVQEISALASELEEARAEAVKLRAEAQARAQQVASAERSLTEQRLTSEQQLHEVQLEIKATTAAKSQQQIDAAKAEAEAGWSELVDILQTQSQEAVEETEAAKRRAADSQQALELSTAETAELRRQIAKLRQDLPAQEERAPLSDPAAELERQGLLNQIAAAESRATALEKECAESVKAAREQTEAQILEDVEEMIHGLEDSNRTLQAQLDAARADPGAAGEAGDAAVQARLDALAAQLAEARAESERSLEFATEQAADSDAVLAQEKALRSKVEAELASLQEATLGGRAGSSDAAVAELAARVAGLTGQLAEARQAAQASESTYSEQLNAAELKVLEETSLREEKEAELAQLATQVGELKALPVQLQAAQPPGAGPIEEAVPPAPLDLSSTKAVVPVASSATQSVSVHDDLLRELYAAADVNGDGNVSRSELVESLRRDTSLQRLFNLPVGKRIGAEERLRIEAIFDDMDHDRSFGISYEEFAEYVQKKFECLPVIASGSYALGQRVISVADDGSISVTDPSELNEQKRVLFHDSGSSTAVRSPSPVRTPTPSRRPRSKSGSSRRSRGGVFTYHAGDAVDTATREIADLVGVTQIGMENIVCEEFFGRRTRFRQSMKSKVRQELKLNKRKTHPLDLPGFWVRPSLSAPYDSLMEPFTLKVHLPKGAEVEIECQPEETMSEVLEMVLSECEDVEEDSAPDEGHVGFVLKARGIYNYLDGDERMIDYTFIRDQLKNCLVPEVLAIPREDAIADCAKHTAPDLTDDAFAESGSDEDEDYEMLERSFDWRATRTSWPFIPVSEVHSSVRVRLDGINNLQFEDGKPDPWVDPFLAAASLEEKAKTPRRRRGSVFGGKSDKDKQADEEAEKPKKVATLPRRSMEASGSNTEIKLDSHGNPVEPKVSPSSAPDMVYVEAGLYYGGEQLSKMVRTHRQPRSANPHFHEVLDFEFELAKLPRSTKVCFTLWKVGEDQHEDDATPLGWVGMYLFDDMNRLKQGQHSFLCWPMDRANPIGTCEENMGGEPDMTPVVTVHMDQFPKTVLFPRSMHLTGGSAAPLESGHSTEPWTRSERDQVKHLLLADPLEELTPKDKRLMWKLRYMCTTRPEGLAKVLRSADWTDSSAVQEVHRLLDEWEPLTPKLALELLDAHYPDERVRSYAIECLKPLRDDELALYVLQLVQVLKYEVLHDSQLACFLLVRAIRCPNLVGHIFFWHLKAEMHIPEISERYGMLIELYLELAPAHRKDLHTQNVVQELLITAARSIKDKAVKKKDRLSKLRSVLAATDFPEEFGLPLNPEWVCTGLRVEKCRFMDSKKLPLWLCFTTAPTACDPEGKNLLVMFKDGDDLRQDLLTLQVSHGPEATALHHHRPN